MVTKLRFLSLVEPLLDSSLMGCPDEIWAHVFCWMDVHMRWPPLPESHFAVNHVIYQAGMLGQMGCPDDWAV